MVSKTAICSIPPSKFGDEKYVIRLVGKRLNTSDELGSAKAISSDTFKKVITGDSVSARDLYESVVDFYPEAQNVFACNQLPSFQGGMDRGVLRRLLVVVFNRKIPEEERVLLIGDRILAEERDLALSWVIEGAARLVRGGHFTEPLSSKIAVQEWSQGSDAALAWAADRTQAGDDYKMTSQNAYADFSWWARDNGYEKLAVNTFTQRLKPIFKYKHSGDFRGFLGVRVKQHLGEVRVGWL